MKDTDTLTKLLHDRAERNLRAKIASEFPKGYALGSEVELPQRLAAALRSSISLGTAEKPAVIHVPTLLEALHAVAFNHWAPSARANEVRDFLKKVDAAADAIEDLREGGAQ